MNLADSILEDSEIPVVRVRREGPHLIFTEPCPYCGRRHRHGARGGYGHRAAHCFGAPGSLRGYRLVSATG